MVVRFVKNKINKIKKTKEIPIKYFPTTVLLVDDNQRFLKNITFQMNDNLAYQFFTDPRVALEYLNGLSIREPKYMFEDTNSNSYLTSKFSVQIDLDAFRAEVYNKDRFTKIVVVVIDYGMPEINGLEFCQRIKDPRIKKIMLTGEADLETAMHAFNEGIIDKFIFKSNPKLGQVINDSIVEMQEKYFLELSKDVSNILNIDPNYCLNDPKIVEIFDYVCRKYNIIEYYVFDIPGSFLLLDMEGKPSWFIIKNQEEIDVYAEIAKEDNISPELYQQLVSGSKIPFLPKDAIGQKCNWDNALYPAHKIESEKNYYCALIKDIKDERLSSNIGSYTSYLEKINLQFVGEDLLVDR